MRIDLVKKLFNRIILKNLDYILLEPADLQ